MPVATATMTRIQKLFRRPSSPRKGQSGGGGAWDETKYGGRTTSTTSRTSSSGSIESMGSLDTSFRSRRPSSEPKPADRVTWADAPTWIDPPASYDFTDPAELWWTAAERREQLARTEWLVALETKRKLRDELRPPIPGESRRGLGVACEPSTPAARAAKIASHRRAIVAASRDAARARAGPRRRLRDARSLRGGSRRHRGARRGHSEGDRRSTAFDTREKDGVGPRSSRGGSRRRRGARRGYTDREEELIGRFPRRRRMASRASRRTSL